MARKDYYQILEVPQGASQEEIKKAYKKLAKIHHPDRNQGSTESEAKFKEINEAYETLGDANKRVRYDRGEDQHMNGFPGDFSSHMQDFHDFFTGGRTQRRQQSAPSGSDLRVKIILNIQEIFNGVTKKIKYRREVICGHCNGSGAADSNSIETCQTCHGAGMIQKVMNTIVGSVVTSQTCPTCGGKGKTVKSHCQHCSGHGVVLQEETIDLTIPRSVANGDTLSVAGAGNASRHGGQFGSLLVFVEEENGGKFARNGSDLLSFYTVNIGDAVLGSDLEVDTVDGKVKIKINPGTQSGSRLRIEGKGLYKTGTNYRGDLYVDISVHIPKELNEETRGIFEKLRELLK